MKIIIVLVLLSLSFSVSPGSPFFDSSVYVTGVRANVRTEPAVQAEIAFVAEANRAFKYLETVETDSEDNRYWYKIEYYDPNEFEIYYKPRTSWTVNPLNFSKMVELYEDMDLGSDTISIMPNRRNSAYDNRRAEKREWVRVRVNKAKTAYVAKSVASRIDRPYFLTEIALEAIARNRAWDFRTRQNILNGELFRNMTPAMVRAVKGEPDNIFEDRTGRNLYYSWIYGSQTLNFRNNRLTSW